MTGKVKLIFFLFFLLILSSFAYGGTQQDIWDKTVACYPLDNNSNDCKNGFDGTDTSMLNGTLFIINHSMLADASTDRILIGDFTNFSFTDGAGNDEPFALDVWVNPTSHSATANFIITKEQSGSREWGLATVSGGLIFQIFDAGGDKLKIDTTETLALNTWHHIIARYSGNNSETGMEIFINGTKASTTSGSTGVYGGMSNTGTAVEIFNWASNSFAFAGTMDEANIYNDTLTQTEIDFRYNSGAGIRNAPEPPSSISVVFLEAIPRDSDGSSTNIGFNSGNLSAIETVKLRYNITAINSDISDFYFNFTAGGFSSCSLGNLQDSTCYNVTNTINKWIQVINGTLTSTYDSTESGGNVGDRVDFQFSINNVSDSMWELNVTIDEHYNPNVAKHYGAVYNFSDVKWQDGVSQRITQNNFIRVNLTDLLIPLDADQYKLDIRVNFTTSQPPNQPLEAWACNSTTFVGNPPALDGCVLVAAKLSSELQDDGTKFRGIFTKQLVDELGDIGYIVLKTDEANPNRYYYIKSYKATASSYITKWKFSTDTGATYTNLGDDYETELNINWFYNGASPTEFIFNLWTNNSAGDEANFTQNITWSITANQSYPPLVDLLTPAEGGTVTQSTINVSWIATDPNDDELNITVFLDDIIQITNLNQSNLSFHIISAVPDGSHNVTVRAEKKGNSGFFNEDVHTFTVSLAPFDFSVFDVGIDWMILNWSGVDETTLAASTCIGNGSGGGGGSITAIDNCSVSNSCNEIVYSGNTSWITDNELPQIDNCSVSGSCGNVAYMDFNNVGNFNITTGNITLSNGSTFGLIYFNGTHTIIT